MPDPKPVPLGKPLHLNDKQLEQAAQVTDVDIEKTKAFWRNNAPKKWKTLLDAQPVEEGNGEQ